MYPVPLVLGPLPGPLVALGAVSGATLVAFLLAGRALRADDDTRTATRLRTAMKLGLPAAYVVALLATSLARWPATVEGAAASVPGGPVVEQTLSLLGVYATPLVAVVFGYLGAFPTIRATRGVEMSATAAAGRLVRYLFGLAALVVVLAVASTAVAGQLADGVGLVVAVVVAVVGLLGATPWLVRFVQPTRAPTDEERRRIDRLSTVAGLEARGVRVLETEDAKTAAAVVRGLPGLRHLLVSDYLLSAADDDTLSAFLSLQAARARRWYLEARLAATLVAFGGPLALVWDVLSVPGVGTGTATLASATVGVAGLWFGRRLVFLADAEAADRTDPETVVATLEWFADVHDAPLERGRLQSLLKMEPSLADRIDRLGGDGE
ncbi:MAG: hypothetical protein ABEH35_06905 [Haloarculaceae archaeon]